MSGRSSSGLVILPGAHLPGRHDQKTHGRRKGKKAKPNQTDPNQASRDRLASATSGRAGLRMASRPPSSARTGVSRYIGGDYRDMNAYRRGIERGTPPRHIVEANNSLDAGFQDVSPTTGDIQAFRGVASGQKVFGTSWNDSDMVGVEFTDPGYESLTTNPNEAQNFTSKYTGSGVVMRVLVPEGTRAMNLGEAEQEVLVGPGHHHRVIADNGTKDGVRYLDVEIISDVDSDPSNQFQILNKSEENEPEGNDLLDRLVLDYDVEATPAPDDDDDEEDDPVTNLTARSRDWFRISNRRDRTAEVMIYDEIGMFGVTASDFARELSSVDTDEITLRLNTPGGGVFDGLTIYNSLKNHPARVKVFIDGLAASIGSVIAMAGDEVKIAKTGTIMIHEGHAVCAGNAQAMREMMELLDQQSSVIAGVYADRAGGTVDEWRTRMRAETWYNAPESVAAKLVDEVYGTAPKAQTGFSLKNVYRYDGRDAAPAPDVPPAPETPAPAPATVPSSQDETDSQGQEPATSDVDVSQPILFDGDAFRVAMRIAVEPPVPTDQAPFEWDPEVFRAIMADKTLTAPAVVSNPAPAVPQTFETMFDPDLFRQAVIEGVSK